MVSGRKRDWRPAGTGHRHRPISGPSIRPWPREWRHQKARSGTSWPPPRLSDHPIPHRMTSNLGVSWRGLAGGQDRTPQSTPKRAEWRRTRMDEIEQKRTAKSPDFSRAYPQSLLNLGAFEEAWKQPDGSPGWIFVRAHNGNVSNIDERKIFDFTGI